MKKCNGIYGCSADHSSSLSVLRKSEMYTPWFLRLFSYSVEMYPLRSVFLWAFVLKTVIIGIVVLVSAVLRMIFPGAVVLGTAFLGAGWRSV